MKQLESDIKAEVIDMQNAKDKTYQGCLLCFLLYALLSLKKPKVIDKAFAEIKNHLPLTLINTDSTFQDFLYQNDGNLSDESRETLYLGLSRDKKIRLSNTNRNAICNALKRTIRKRRTDLRPFLLENPSSMRTPRMETF